MTDAFATQRFFSTSHSYEYDKAGNRIAVTYADGRKVSTTYDALKRPSVLVDDNGTPLDSTDNQTTRYGYDLAGRAVQLIAQNGQVTRNDYDELGRLTARTLFRSLTEMNDAGRLASFTWTHDAIGNVLTQTEFWFASGAQPARQRATAMTNDAANRLVSETITVDGGRLHLADKKNLFQIHPLLIPCCTALITMVAVRRWACQPTDMRWWWVIPSTTP